MAEQPDYMQQYMNNQREPRFSYKRDCSPQHNDLSNYQESTQGRRDTSGPRQNLSLQRSGSNPRSILKNSTKKLPGGREQEEVQDGYTEYFSQGCDRYGQLGHGQEPSKHDPNRAVSVPKSLSFDILIKLVACGAKHSLILSKRGELFSIGSNSQGQLGLNDRELEYTTAPLLIQDFQTLGAQVEQLACGANHNLVLTRDGQLFSWGSNQHGECGQIPNSHQSIHLPLRLCSPDINSHKITQIECGDKFSGFLTASGVAYAFGDNSEGQLGTGQQYMRQTHEPSRIALDEDIKQISFGYRHILLLTQRGDVYGAGLNANHQLGLGKQTNASQSNFFWPVRIEALGTSTVTKVVAGGFSAALTFDHQILVWGEGDFGTFESQQRLYMDQIHFVDCKLGKFQQITAAFATDKEGRVYSWGQNNLGQLGHGDQRSRKLPMQIQSLKRKNITQLAVGLAFTVMLGRDISLAEQEIKKQKKKKKELSKAQAEKDKMGNKQAEKHSDARTYQWNNELDKTREFSNENINRERNTSNNGRPVAWQNYESEIAQCLPDQTYTQSIGDYQNMHDKKDSCDMLYNNLQKVESPNQNQMQYHPSFGNFDNIDQLDPNAQQPEREKDAFQFQNQQQRCEDPLVKYQKQQEEMRSKSRSREREQPVGQAPLSSRFEDARFRSEQLLSDVQITQQTGRCNNQNDRLSNNNVSPMSNQFGDSEMTQQRKMPAIIGETAKNNLQLKLQRNSEILEQLHLRTNSRSNSKSNHGEAKSASKLEQQYQRSASPMVSNIQNQLTMRGNVIDPPSAMKNTVEPPSVMRSNFVDQQANVLSRSPTDNISQTKSPANHNQNQNTTDAWRECFEAKRKVQDLEKEVEVLNAAKQQLESELFKANRSNETIQQMKFDENTLRCRIKDQEAQSRLLQNELEDTKALLIKTQNQFEMISQANNMKDNEFYQEKQRFHQIEEQQKNQMAEEKQKMNELERTNDQNERLILDLNKSNHELTEQLGHKEIRLNHNLQQMRDDENKVRTLEEKLREQDDYIQTILFEQNEYKLKAHNSDLEHSNLKHEIQRLEGTVQNVYAEKENHQELQKVRERDMKQLEQGLDVLKANFEEQVQKLQTEKDQLHDQNEETQLNNKKLVHLLNQKTIEVQSHLRSIEDGCLQRSQVERENKRLEELLKDLQEKNSKLSQLMDQNMYHRAEHFKNRINDVLTRPRSAMAESKPPLGNQQLVNNSHHYEEKSPQSVNIGGQSLIDQLKSINNPNSEFNQQFVSQPRQSDYTDMPHEQQIMNNSNIPSYRPSNHTTRTFRQSDQQESRTYQSRSPVYQSRSPVEESRNKSNRRLHKPSNFNSSTFENNTTIDAHNARVINYENGQPGIRLMNHNPEFTQSSSNTAQLIQGSDNNNDYVASQNNVGVYEKHAKKNEYDQTDRSRFSNDTEALSDAGYRNANGQQALGHAMPSFGAHNTHGQEYQLKGQGRGEEINSEIQTVQHRQGAYGNIEVLNSTPAQIPPLSGFNITDSAPSRGQNISFNKGSHLESADQDAATALNQAAASHFVAQNPHESQAARSPRSSIRTAVPDNQQRASTGHHSSHHSRDRSPIINQLMKIEAMLHQK